MASIHEFEPKLIEGTRGYLVIRIHEGDNGMYAEGLVYDGLPQPLQTPESGTQDTTTASVRSWAINYANQFLPEMCIECEGTGYLTHQSYGHAEMPMGWTTVQACDACNKFSDPDGDEHAARAAAKRFGVVAAYFPGVGDDPGDWAINAEVAK